MFKFNRTSEFLVCIDSDGTVMDSMTIKHKKCFGPLFLETFNILTHKNEILDYWNDVNLYKQTRGINRFQGLVKGLEYAKTFGYEFEGFEEFKNWVLKTKEFSERLLKEEIEKVSNNSCLKLALEWSKKVNLSIQALPIASPFKGVKEAIKYINESVDVIGVSSANREAVEEEWSKHNIKKYFKAIACQDSGSKKKIIHDALLLGYDRELTIMVGDALGDYKAAKENGIRFFPIIPQREEYSWKKLKDEGIKKLVNYQFDDDYQQQLIDEFFNSLSK